MSGNGIAVGSDGSAYVVGSTRSTNFPTASPFQANNAGNGDAFVTRLSPSGSSLVYSTYLGGVGSDGQPGDSGLAIAVSADGSAHVTGHTTSSSFPTAAPVQASLAGFEDAFVTKLRGRCGLDVVGRNALRFERAACVGGESIGRLAQARLRAIECNVDRLLAHQTQLGEPDAVS